MRSIAITVTDTAGIPISDAQLVLAGTNILATTDRLGRGLLRNVDWGPQTVLVRKIGYRGMEQQLVVPADGSVAANIVLSRLAVVLGGVIVRDRAEKPARLDGTTRFDEFYNRRASESGTFITREDIDKRNPGRAIDLFMGIPGIRLTYRGSTPLISFARCKAGVEVFIDGQRLNDGLNALTTLHPNQIEAIEVYHGLASVPPQFIPKPDDCAAILVWTRYN